MLRQRAGGVLYIRANMLLEARAAGAQAAQMQAAVNTILTHNSKNAIAEAKGPSR